MKIRSIHPGFFNDRKLASLTYEARLLYAGLWCHSDDYGRGKYLPKAIEGAVFPHDPIDITSLLMSLERAGLIRVYEVRGEVFYEIPKWEDYQSPRYKAKQVIPPPEAGEYRKNPTNTYPGLFSTDPAQSVDRVSPDSPSGVERELSREVVVARQVTDPAQISEFNRSRAATELNKRGKQVANPTGYAAAIAADPQFRKESERLFAHQSCTRCKGKGSYDSDYAPGAGVRKITCEEPV